jgi:hypothetical protein
LLSLLRRLLYLLFVILVLISEGLTAYSDLNKT